MQTLAFAGELSVLKEQYLEYIRLPILVRVGHVSCFEKNLKISEVDMIKKKLLIFPIQA